MDVDHWWGDDLAWSPTGDIAMVDGLDRGRQRVIRRLMTATRDYLWHADYGAGLPGRVGQTLDTAEILAVIRSQLMKEACVGRNPLPYIEVRPIVGGVFVTIQFFNVETGAQDTLDFDVKL